MRNSMLMRKIRLTIKLSIIASILGLALSTNTALAWGIAPGTVLVENIAVGSSVDQLVSFTRYDASEAAYGQVAVEGDAAPFIELVDGNTFVFEEGEIEKKYRIRIHTQEFDEDGNVIRELPADTYYAVVGMAQTDGSSEEEAAKSDSNTQGAGQKFLAGAKAEVEFTVTNDKIEEYTVSDFVVQDSEELIPIGFSYVQTNTGNVSSKPDRIELNITNAFDQSFSVDSVIEKDVLPFVDPFSTEEVNITTDIELEPGSYTFVATFFDRDGNEIYKHSGIGMQVFPAGTLDQSAELLSFTADKTEYEAGELINFTGSIENSGEVGLSAKLVTEIVKDGKNVDIITSDEVFVPTNREIEIEHSFRPKEGGKYVLTGYFKYGPFKTDEAVVEVQVGELGISTVLISVFVLIIVIFLAAIVIRKRNKTKGYITGEGSGQGGSTDAGSPPSTNSASTAGNSQEELQKEIERLQQQVKSMNSKQPQAEPEEAKDKPS